MPRLSLLIKLPVTLLLLVFILVKCTGAGSKKTDPRGNEYAGSVACRTCHTAVYDSFMHTAHFLATSAPDYSSMKGAFEQDRNTFSFGDGQVVKMERRGSGLFQVLYTNGQEIAAYPFDISFGKKNARTWLYWKGNNTYQLPVSYYTSVSNWGTSPGFSLQYPYFDRLVGRNCFECHSSAMDYMPGVDSPDNVQAGPVIKEKMDRKSFVAGIDCERCHGPAAAHIHFHEQNPGQTAGRFITRIMHMSSQQQLDACAVCHSGNDRVKFNSRFAFKPGDTLSHFFGSLQDTIIKTEPDVHGNQYGLLSQSRCFTGSVQLTCNTCHDPHRDAADNLSLYSSKCLGCHKEGSPQFCTVKPQEGTVLTSNCIDCHMPNQPSAAISFQLSGSSQRISYLLRTHKIGIYPANDKQR
jgi:hypothetical protein